MVYAPSSTTCETSSAMRKMFNAADKNGDGGLSEQEFQAYMQNNLKRSSLGGAGTAFQDLFDQIDANDDQMIDFEEFKKLTCSAAQFAEDVTGADTDRGPASVPDNCATEVAVTNNTGGQGQGSGSQGDHAGCEHQDPVAALSSSLGELGLDSDATMKILIDNGLVDVACDQSISANSKTEQFLGQLNQLKHGSSEGVNEVLGKRIEWLVDDGATWEGATQFMFDQGAIKADYNGNMVFNYPKGLTLNHYLCQLMDPSFRTSEQSGNEALDLCVGATYDKMVGAGKDPIDVLNMMMDSDLAAINDKGQIMPTGKTGGYNADLSALISGDHGDSVDPYLGTLFSSVTQGGSCPKDFMKYMIENDLMAVSEEGKPILSEKGTQFNHDLMQLVDTDFREAHVGIDGGIDAEVAQIYDALRTRGTDPMGAIQYLVEHDLAVIDSNGTIQQTATTDQVAHVLTDFGVA